VIGRKRVSPLNFIPEDDIFEDSVSKTCQKKSPRIEIFIGHFSTNSLDNFHQLRHSGLEKMKTFSIFRRESRSNNHDQDSQIRVYRSHAARAISEERWEVAEIFIDRILKVDPHHTEAWLMKGHLRHHCREDERTAVDCYRKVITLCGPDSVHPHAQRARTSLGRLLTIWS
jgi:regulator of sirC expression with transglutaminase-like and TPR domain